MQRDILLLTEMVDAAEQAGQLTAGVTVSQLETDRQRRDALLWNFTVLGEAERAVHDPWVPWYSGSGTSPATAGRVWSRTQPLLPGLRGVACSSLINWEEFGRSSSG
jgi:hypothetical protein